MTWLRIDDAMMDHPKLLEAGATSTLIHLWAMCYSARFLTDGFVAAGALTGCPWVHSRSARTRAVTRLESVGLWLPDEGGWRINDYLEYNPDSASVKEQRRKAADRVREWRQRQAEKRNGAHAAFRNGVRTAAPSPGLSNDKDVTALQDDPERRARSLEALVRNTATEYPDAALEEELRKRGADDLTVRRMLELARSVREAA